MSFPSYVNVVQAERERQIALDRLARFASRVRACCDPSRVTRLLRALRRDPAACAC